MPTNSPRLGMQIAQGTDNVSAMPGIDSQAKTILDNQAAIFLQGTAAAMPAAGTSGRFYYQTDTGLLKYDNGSAWVTTRAVVPGAQSAIIATPETRTNTAYGLMPTPDQVTNVVLPTPALIAVRYEATWQGTAGAVGAQRAAIFIGTNQAAAAGGGQEAAGSAFTSADTQLFSTGLGLASMNAFSGVSESALAQILGGYASAGQAAWYDFPADSVRQGQVVPGACHIYAPAGTYTVSVQFKASSGSVTVKNRRLYVEVLPG